MFRAFLPAMRARGSGLFINLSSIAGRMALPFFGLYHASKWGVEGYSLGMRRELACTGIDVVVVEPGPFTTQLFPQSPRPEDAEGRAEGYPEVCHQTFAGMGAAFEGLFADSATPTDPASTSAWRSATRVTQPTIHRSSRCSGWTASRRSRWKQASAPTDPDDTLRP
jgi:short-subunit dehydrogenase